MFRYELHRILVLVVLVLFPEKLRHPQTDSLGEVRELFNHIILQRGCEAPLHHCGGEELLSDGDGDEASSNDEHGDGHLEVTHVGDGVAGVHRVA